MKCPMLTMYAMTFERPEHYQDRDCLKEECAWWNHDFEMCCIFEGLDNLLAIANHLGVMVRQMPHGGQFRK